MALVSTPPFAVPPLSLSVTVIVAVPFALAAGVYVSVPGVDRTAGPTEQAVVVVRDGELKLPVRSRWPARR